MRAAAHRGFALCVERVGDGLEGHAGSAHGRDALHQFGAVADCGAPGDASFAGGGQALAGAFGEPLAFPTAYRGQGFGDELPAVGVGIDLEVEDHKPHPRPAEPVEQLPDFGCRPGQARQFGDEQAVGLAAFQARERVAQPGPLESLAVGRFGFAHPRYEGPAARRAGGLDRFGLARRLPLRAGCHAAR